MKQDNFVSLEQALDRHPLMVAPEMSLEEVIALMSQDYTNSCDLEENLAVTGKTRVNLSCILAIADSQLVGIFTEKDLVKLIATRRNWRNLTLADVMHRNVITLSITESQDIFTALNLFHRYKISVLPIIDEKAQPLGLVSQVSLRQILRASDLLKFRIVKDVMSRAIHAQPQASVLEVAQLMNDYQVDCIAIAEPITADSQMLRPLGIITEQDIAQFQSLELNLERLQAQTVMSTPLFIIRELDSLWMVHQQMEQHRIGRLVVAGDRGELLGVISHSGLLRAINIVELRNSLDLLQNQFRALETEKTKSLKRQLKQQTAQLRERTQQEQLAAAIALKIRRTLNLESVLKTTVEEVLRLMQADRVLVYRFDPDWSGIVTTESVSNSQWSILDRVIRDECFESKWIDSYQQGHIHANSDIYHSQLSPCHIEFLEQFQVKANIAVPIILSDPESTDNNHLWGLLIVHQCTSSRNWQESELNLLQLLAIQVAIAIQQSELYQQTQIELQQRQQAEIALKESEQRFRIMANTAPVSIWISETDGQFIFFNQPWLDFTGRTLAQELGYGWTEAVHPEDLQHCLNTYRTAFEARQQFTIEYRLRRADGNYRWVLYKGAPRYTTNGDFAGYIGSCIDISDRVSAEQALQESETQLKTALAAADLGTWSWDITTNAVTLSEYAESILGFAPGAFPGTLEVALNCIHPDDRDTANEKVKQAIEQGGLYDVEQRIVRQNGTIGWIAVRGHILKNSEAQTPKMMGIIADITQKKQLEAQYLRNQRLEGLGSLAGGIAHDLNNILTPIMMSVQLLPLTLDSVNERSQELIEMLDSNVNRGSALVNQILSFARGVEGDRVTLQIRHLIADIKQMIKETFPKSIEVQTDISRDLWTIYGDATQIHQILLNLAVNARDAMPNGGILNLTAENMVIGAEYTQRHPDAKEGSYVAIAISDTGVGIPNDILEQIFEPFFTTKDTSQGTGLGLATVKGIVKSHSGFIEVKSDLNRGTEFKVFLPATTETTSENREAIAIPKGRGELILVVDDEATIREITKASLETHNYQVITAKDGIEAIALYVQNQAKVAAILMNMMMPSMSGSIAIRTLQTINPEIRIIAVSGRNFSEQAFRDREITVRAFLAKPYNTASLLRTMNEVLQA